MPEELATKLASEAQPGTTAGVTPAGSTAFQLLDEIGRGGMGVVHRARDLRLHREVAVKFLLADGSGDTAAADRFRAEAQITGQLQHPGIPAVHELGTLTDGRPFLAMKLVEGRTLQDLLKDRPDPGHDRGRFLAVFEQVCQTVGYAHAHGVIHRDLKPGNVMVGAFGEVQVMDWGLAKRLPCGGTPKPSTAADQEPAVTVSYMPHDPPANEEPAVTWVYMPVDTPGADGSATRTGSVLGTPAYMPPEQAGGEIRKLDARSDVFGLGAILCQVLTGRPPYAGGNANELRIRAVRGEMAEALAALDGSRAEPALVALCKRCLAIRQEERPADGEAVARQVAGVRQAAEERARRAELDRAEALVREGEQRKRRRVLQWAGGTVAGVLLLGVIGTTIGLVRANAAAEKERIANIAAQIEKTNAENAAKREKGARKQTEKRLAQIEKGVDLLAGLLMGINPKREEFGGPTVYQQLRERAEKAADQLDAELVDDPLAVARLQTIYGNTLYELGNATKATEILEKARRTRERDLGADHPDTLSTLNRLAQTYLAAGRTSDAIDLHERVRDAQIKKWGAHHPDTLATLHNLASAYQAVRRMPEAIDLLVQVRDARLKLLPADHPDTLSALNNLALAYEADGRAAEAIDLLEQVRDARLKLLVVDHPDTLATLNNLALCYLAAGRTPDGIDLYERVRDALLKKLGANHPSTLTALANLAEAYRVSGKMFEAIALFEQVRDAQVETLPGDHPSTINTLGNLALAYLGTKRIPEAIALFEQVRDAQMKTPGPDHVATLITLNNLAGAYKAAGRTPEAIAIFQQVRDAQVRKLAADHPDTIATLYNLAETYKADGKMPEAIALFEQVRDDLLIKRGADHLDTLVSQFHLAKAYGMAKQFDKSIPLYEETLKALERERGREDPLTLQTLSNLSANYHGTGRLVEAIPLMEEVYRAAKKRPGLRGVATPLLDAYLKSRKTAEASRLIDELLVDIRERQPPDTTQLLRALTQFGTSLLEAKAYVQAEPLLRESLAMREKAAPVEWWTFHVKSLLGEALLGQKKYTEAEPLLVAGYEGLTRQEKTIPAAFQVRLPQAVERLVQLYEATARPDEAATLRKELAGQKGPPKEP
jgi:serine/threonine protein kinase